MMIMMTNDHERTGGGSVRAKLAPPKKKLARTVEHGESTKSNQVDGKGLLGIERRDKTSRTRFSEQLDVCGRKKKEKK